jgi:hypothetical protein
MTKKIGEIDQKTNEQIEERIETTRQDRLVQEKVIKKMINSDETMKETTTNE